MIKMKSIFLTAATVLTAVTLFTGCSRTDDNSSSGGDLSDSGVQSDGSGSTDGSDDSSGMLDDSGSFSIKDTVESVYNDLMGGEDNWLSEAEQNTMETAYDMDFSNIEEFYGRIPGTNVHATSVIVARAADGKTEEVKKELLKYQAAVEGNFKQYLPDQYELTRNYRIVESGNYVALVMAENAEDIEKALDDAFDANHKNG